MTEALTESFCERCGTRYEFSAPTRLNPLRRTRGLFGGLKNYLTSQDALSDAIGDAMRGEEGALASAQLEAFHESFNFCIDCRQYTCLNCWNDDSGRCRSCAPLPGTDDLAERLEASLAHGSGKGAGVSELTDSGAMGAEAWPVSDLPTLATNGHAPVVDAWASAPSPTFEQSVPGVEQHFIADDGFAYESQEQVDAVNARLGQERAAAEAEREALAAAEVEVEALQPVVAEAEPEQPAAESGTDWETIAAELALEQAAGPVAADAAEARPPLRVVAWDDDAAYDVAEPEPMVAEAAPEPEPEPMVAEAAPEPEPEPTQLPTPIAPIRETILHFPAREAAPPPPAPERVAAEDESPEVAARRAQLDLLGLGDPGEGPIAPEPAVLPYRSRGAAVSQAEIAMRAAPGSFWEASAREVASAVGTVGVQNCGQCGLSLSANARFCRRCGTRQARSA